jgi:phage head maturation protease
MTDCILGEDRRPISIQGYGAMFGTLSLQPDDRGRHLLFGRACCDERLATGANVNLTCFHLDNTALAATSMGTLKVWSDRHIGLAFEATNIAATPKNRSMVAGIAAGRIRGCSILWQPFDERLEDLGYSEPTKVVRKAQVLHITLCSDPLFPTTGCWLSSEIADSLPGHIRWLEREWHKGRSTGLAAVKARQRTKLRSTKPASKPKPNARREIAPFTEYELQALAEEQAAARRMMGAWCGRRRPRIRAA